MMTPELIEELNALFCEWCEIAGVRPKTLAEEGVWEGGEQYWVWRIIYSPGGFYEVVDDFKPTVCVCDMVVCGRDVDYFASHGGMTIQGIFRSRWRDLMTAFLDGVTKDVRGQNVRSLEAAITAEGAA